MAEIILAGVIPVLAEKLVSSDFINLAQSAGILSQMKSWKTKLDLIEPVLVDASRKQTSNHSLQVWLHKLQHLAYHIDNVLDDLAYEALRRELSTGTGSGSTSDEVTCCMNYTPRKLVYGRFELDEITKGLLQLVDQIQILGLTEQSIGTSRRVEQTSLVNESEFVGRKRDKEALLRLLKEPCEENVGVVAIVGMGGVGKTALANALYKEVKGRFELAAWVCVSDDFNLFNLSKAIYTGLGGRDKSFEGHEDLAHKLKEKRFLVVLDDVWNEDDEKWRVFQLLFSGGSRGSKVMVTARNDKVASVIDCVQLYRLTSFSDEEALSFFAQHAKPNFDSNPGLRKLAEEIIQKCGGLPLALRTLGRMLRGKTDLKVWEDLLNSEVWSSQDGSKILPALQLGYYDLPVHLKRVFAYCSLFPKVYVFNKDELVLLWMAEGFLNTEKGKKSMESMGREYFDELKSRSFFEQSTDDGSKYTMHDLIHDLAIRVADEFFFRANDGMENDSPEKFYHVSFSLGEPEQFRKFKQLHNDRHLRTCLALPVSGSNRYLYEGNIIANLLPHLQFLRVLSLTHFSIKEIPHSIGGLKHIRYLNFSRTCVSSLPEEVCNLYNLQSLLIRDCDQLRSLPHSFEKLINLRHLDIKNSRRLKKLPLGIGGLTSLQTLSKVIIEEADGFKISELKGLSNIHGELLITGLSKVRSVKHVQEAKLDQKEGLDDLELDWGIPDILADEETAYRVLQGLRPHSNLRKLTISSYNGTKIPSWVGDPSFTHLTELRLFRCGSCTCLPTLGQLPLLRSLFLIQMMKVTTLDSKLLGPASFCQAFPALEVLEFEHMHEWRIWSTNVVGNNGTVGSFPKLREICIRECPILNDLSIGSMPSLDKLHIFRCPELVLRNIVGSSSSICRLEIEGIKGLTHLCQEVIERLGALEYLCITACRELTCLWESESEASKILVNLQELKVASCVNLLSVGGKDVNFGVHMNSARKVTILSCAKVESYKCPNGIERLEIMDCASLSSLNFELPSTLRSLCIICCEIPEDSCFHNNLPSLESLSIYSLLNLRSFSEGFFAHLMRLEIVECDEIEYIPETGFGFLPHLCLRYLRIESCKNLKSFPHQHLQRLTSLKEMRVTHCPSMNDSFPCGSWPPNLSSLSIGNLMKPMSEWGSQNFPASLSMLNLEGRNSRVASFANNDDVMNSDKTTALCILVPSSITSLSIKEFIHLESLSEGLQHLTCLKALNISKCPKVRDLPTTLLPSLLELRVNKSRELKKRCDNKEGDYWPIISEIPAIYID